MSDPKTIELSRVSDAQRPELHALFDDYLAELATHRERPVGPERASAHPYLPAYWEEPGRHPFFIELRGERAGFVLVREVPAEGVIQMSEFFIRSGFRRMGVGRGALAEVWRVYPGSWELQVHLLNEAASAFWPQCIAEFSHGVVRSDVVQEEDGGRLQYEFEIAPAIER